MRDAFLRALAAELERYPDLGPGLIHRVGSVFAAWDCSFVAGRCSGNISTRSWAHRLRFGYR